MKAANTEPRIIGSIQLVGIRESVSYARSQVRKWLGNDHLAVDDAVLAVSELVTNAFRHSDARPYDFIGLTVTATVETVFVAVRDPGSAFSDPYIRQEPEAEDGRGLLIVREISQSWGIREHGRGLGRTVWCAIRATPPSADPSAAEPVSGSAADAALAEQRGRSGPGGSAFSWRGSGGAAIRTSGRDLPP